MGRLERDKKKLKRQRLFDIQLKGQKVIGRKALALSQQSEPKETKWKECWLGSMNGKILRKRHPTGHGTKSVSSCEELKSDSIKILRPIRLHLMLHIEEKFQSM